MTGRFHIDEIDAYARYGVFVADEGLAALMQWPPLKKVSSVDWHEEDGEDFDLTAPALDTKTFAIKFASHNANNVGGLIEMLSDKGYHDFTFPVLGRTFKLRLVDQSSLVVFPGMKTFSLSFADDFPLEGYTYAPPQSNYDHSTGYKIDHPDHEDGIDLGRYGVAILEGTLAEIEKSPAVKQNLLRNIGSKSGAIYDGQAVTFAAKDVKLNCFMRADSTDELWRNYNALLYDLTRQEERRLYVDDIGEEYPCYYKSASVSKFLPTGKIWLEFGITLCFTSFRVGDTEYLLASEDGELFVLEEDDNVFIDMGYGV